MFCSNTVWRPFDFCQVTYAASWLGKELARSAVIRLRTKFLQKNPHMYACTRTCTCTCTHRHTQTHTHRHRHTHTHRVREDRKRYSLLPFNFLAIHLNTELDGDTLLVSRFRNISATSHRKKQGYKNCTDLRLLHIEEFHCHIQSIWQAAKVRQRNSWNSIIASWNFAYTIVKFGMFSRNPGGRPVRLFLSKSLWIIDMRKSHGTMNHY